MKKAIFIASAIAVLASCSTPAKLISTSTSEKTSSSFLTTAVIADIQVSETKLSFLYIPSKTVIAGGYDNIIQTAVREALMSVGKEYDVLIAKETQVKYDGEFNVESVLVTGYPGRYVNWRHSDEPVYDEPVSVNKNEHKGGMFSIFKGKNNLQ